MSIDRSAVIHPGAIIEDGAVIGPGARIGPWCMVGAEVRLGARVELKSHVVVAGRTEIGDDTVVWPFASLGQQPQDLKYRGEKTKLIIGARNMIREYVTMNPGTEGGGGVTRVGDGCLFMVSTHVAHDCRVGDGVIMANNVPLAGHVTVGDNAILGGNAAIHQNVRIGRGAMIGGLTGVEQDVIPFGTVLGDRAALGGLNVLGLRRAGVSKAGLDALRAAYRAVFEGEGDSLRERARAARESCGDEPLARELIDFILADSVRGICTPRRS